jgi:hypothetical protein
MVAFISQDSTISLLGVSIKDSSGVKELLLALAATMSLAISTLSASRDIMIWIAEGVAERKNKADVIPFARMSLPSAFALKWYMAKQRERWIFPTLLTNAVSILLSLIVTVLFFSMISASVIISIAICVADISRSRFRGLVQRNPNLCRCKLDTQHSMEYQIALSASVQR